MMIYEGSEVFSLSSDIRRIIPEISMSDAKALLAGELSCKVNATQYEALQKLSKLYSPLIIDCEINSEK